MSELNKRECSMCGGVIYIGGYYRPTIDGEIAPHEQHLHPLCVDCWGKEWERQSGKSVNDEEVEG